MAILKYLYDIANDKQQSKKLYPCHSCHSLPGAWIDRRTVSGMLSVLLYSMRQKMSITISYQKQAFSEIEDAFFISIFQKGGILK